MARFRATVGWTLDPAQDFAAGRYSRAHGVDFGSGQHLDATASAHVVGKWAAPGAADPEEMLVAAISSCHMLSFLHAARLAGFTVAAYRDEAEGLLARDGEGRLAVTEVVLRPRISYADPAPDAAAALALHDAAHEACFIANSVKTKVSVKDPQTTPSTDSARRSSG